jgi:hypothetical protein
MFLGHWWTLLHKVESVHGTRAASKTLYTADPGIAYGIRVPTSKKCQVNPACKANEKLLYMMNLNDMPPPGSPGSPFKKMQYPPPGVLKPS